MPGRTARKTSGRTITKDRQAAAATTTTNQGAGLGRLLGMVLGIAIGIAIEIVIEMKAVARTTGGRIITKDLQAAALTATTAQGAGLGHLLGKVLCITIGTAIEIKIEMEVVAGTKIAIGTTPGG